MISHIQIRDFAIIEHIDIDIPAGFSAITGETGAGKSIIIEAVSTALGARADRASVRTGREKALIQIVIDEKGIPEDTKTGAEVLSREIAASGKSVCKVNGEIVTLSQLSETTKKIADIHGQYDHQSLLDPAHHLKIIDAYRTDYITPAKARVSDAWEIFADVKRKLATLLTGEATQRRELDFLRYEVTEIDGAQLRPGEYDAVKEEVQVMQNAERIAEALAGAAEALTEGEPGVISGLSAAAGAIESISELSPEYKVMEESVRDAYYTLDEIAVSLRDKLDSLDFSEQAINDKIARLDLIEHLIAKYGIGTNEENEDDPVERILLYRDNAAGRLSDIENFDDRKSALNADLAKAEDILKTECDTLSSFRKKAAQQLERQVTKELIGLNFSDASFSAVFEDAPYSADGTDKMEFFLSANKGQPLMPVAKVASGGEASRIMLALKSVIGEFDHIPTMIFDEIDSGISGITASVVGEKLHQMAKNHQIISITHLPQIAAAADHQFVIEKNSDDENTYTTVREITGEERVLEVARLLGGKNVTDTTLKSARELIALSR
jgi:DNA repair protein RecN (Recombination protein N)